MRTQKYIEFFCFANESRRKHGDELPPILRIYDDLSGAEIKRFAEGLVQGLHFKYSRPVVEVVRGVVNPDTFETISEKTLFVQKPR